MAAEECECPCRGGQCHATGGLLVQDRALRLTRNPSRGGVVRVVMMPVVRCATTMGGDVASVQQDGPLSGRGGDGVLQSPLKVLKVRDQGKDREGDDDDDDDDKKMDEEEGEMSNSRIESDVSFRSKHRSDSMEPQV